MSIINLFLQKRKMHENQHGIIMVCTAYALSALMLIMGSDVFYNLNSTAAGISSTTDEGTQETTKEADGELPDLKPVNPTALLMRPPRLPSMDAQAVKTGSGGTPAEEAPTQEVIMWLFGNAMSPEEYEDLIRQVSSQAFISGAANIRDAAAEEPAEASGEEKTAAAKSDKTSKKKEEIFSLSAEEASGAYVIDITKEEVEMLERIVQAEAGGEDMVGKILIANVVLNRIADKAFPDTVEDVIFQNNDGDYQFSPVDDERYWSVKISDDTEEAVERALEGEDYSKGALYFMARKKTSAGSAQWFDDHLKRLFKHGGHEFYK